MCFINQLKYFLFKAYNLLQLNITFSMLLLFLIRPIKKTGLSTSAIYLFTKGLLNNNIKVSFRLFKMSVLYVFTLYLYLH